MDLLEFPDDMSPEERKILREYRKNGCPGLARIDETKVVEWAELYKAGKTYGEIAFATNCKKNIILYVAQRSRWHEKRMSTFKDVSDQLMEKIGAARVNSANTVATMIAAWNKYYTKKLNRYLATNDDTIMESLNTKNLAEYRKIIEALDKLISNGKLDPSQPEESGGGDVNININTPTGTVEQPKTVEISSQQTNKERFKALLRIKKERESKKS